MARFPSFSLGGRERAILQGVEQHLSMAKTTVIAYQTLVASLAAAEVKPSPQSLVDAVFDAQMKTKELRKDLSMKIAEGAFFGGVREDILNLIQTDDDIAKSAKDATRLVMIGADSEPGYANVLKSEHMSRFQSNLLSSVTSLEALIQALQVDKKTVLSKVQAVEDYEEEADIEKDHLLRQLFGRPRTLDPVSIIELRDFIFASDDIADNAEDASDVILVLVAKGYG